MGDPAREPNPPRLAGLLLAGGRSRRFGSEKAVAPFRGRPMMECGLSALDAVCEAVAVSAPKDSAAAALARDQRRAVLTDDPAHPSGPLAGIAAGLAWARYRGFGLLATLPCDTPLITEREIGALLARLGLAPACFAVTPSGPHPLVAIWSVDVAQKLTARLVAGEHPSVRSLLAKFRAVEVAFDDAPRFANANTVDALRRSEASDCSRPVNTPRPSGCFRRRASGRSRG